MLWRLGWWTNQLTGRSIVSRLCKPYFFSQAREKASSTRVQGIVLWRLSMARGSWVCIHSHLHERHSIHIFPLYFEYFYQKLAALKSRIATTDVSFVHQLSTKAFFGQYMRVFRISYADVSATAWPTLIATTDVSFPHQLSTKAFCPVGYAWRHGL